MSENMVLNTLQSHFSYFFYRFKPQINFDNDFYSVGTINLIFFSNEYKNMKDKYFSHNWLLREQELQVKKGTAVFDLKIQLQLRA